MTAISSRSVVGQGFSTGVNVTVANFGGFASTFNITVYASDTPIGAVANVILADNSNKTSTIVWNTTGYRYGNYVLTTYLEPFSGTKIANVNCTGYAMTMAVPGGCNGDGKVNVLDLILIATRLGIIGGSYAPYSPDWYKCMNTDLNNDGQHNRLDLIICATHLGQHL